MWAAKNGIRPSFVVRENFAQDRVPTTKVAGQVFHVFPRFFLGLGRSVLVPDFVSSINSTGRIRMGFE